MTTNISTKYMTMEDKAKIYPTYGEKAQEFLTDNMLALTNEACLFFFEKMSWDDFKYLYDDAVSESTFFGLIDYKLVSHLLNKYVKDNNNN